jgi:hypothetical protein
MLASALHESAPGTFCRPSDSAILDAMALLSALGNTANTQALLDTLAEHKRAIDDAICGCCGGERGAGVTC